MPTWTEDEIATLTEDESLAETVYYYPCFGGSDVIAVWAEGIEVSGVFVDSYRALDLVFGQVATTEPALHLDASDVQTLMPKDRFVIRGLIYEVTNVEPDGAGLTIVRLTRA
jgi:hypothetical protein